MPEKKPYDVKELMEKFKARGLEVSEDLAKGLVEDTFTWAEESAKISKNPYDDMALIVLPKVKEGILGQVDKIDGQVG